MIRAEWRDQIRQMVDDWPPVAPDTYAQLALLLAPAPASVRVTSGEREEQPRPMAA